MRPSVTDSGSSGNTKHRKYQQKLHLDISYSNCRKPKAMRKCWKKVERGQKKSYFRGIRITADFSPGTMQARREEWNIESAIRKKKST